MHDDVHGTAVVTLAAALAACASVGRELEDAVVGQLGLGAAGFGIAALMKRRGRQARDRLRPGRGAATRGRASTGIEVADMETVMARGRRARRDDRPARA